MFVVGELCRSRLECWQYAVLFSPLVFYMLRIRIVQEITVNSVICIVR